MDPTLTRKSPGGRKRSFADAELSVNTDSATKNDHPRLSLLGNADLYSQKRRHSIAVDSPDDGGGDSAFYSQEDMSSADTTPTNSGMHANEPTSPVNLQFMTGYQHYPHDNEAIMFDGQEDYFSPTNTDATLSTQYAGSNQSTVPSSQRLPPTPTLYANTMLPPNHPLATPEMRRAQHPPSCSGCPVCIGTTMGPMQGTVAPTSLSNTAPWSMQLPEQFTLFPSSPFVRNNGPWPGNSRGPAHPFANSPLNSTQNGASGSGQAIYGRVRANPQIRLTPVDSSCSYVICDAKAPGTPILHCSPGFTSLTGYSLSEIIGRNCSFLQTPDGIVPPYKQPRDNCVDLSSVARLRQSIANREEIQITLINYRKGGHPFVNILTIIPLRDLWGEVHQFIGLQVDAVETPEAIREVHLDGSYTMDYRRRPAK